MRENGTYLARASLCREDPSVLPARAVAISTMAVLAIGTSTGCHGSTAHADARAHAVGACHDYRSVNGMTGDQGRARYRAGSHLAAEAATGDESWRALANAYAEMAKFADDLQATLGHVTPTEQQAGLQATRYVANTCARILKSSGS